MKFNLEKRPNLVTEVTDPNNVERYLVNKNKEMEKWFEGRKKELKEEIQYLKSMEPEELYEYVHSKKLEKEILG